MKQERILKLMYCTKSGRVLTSVMLRTDFPKVIVAYLRSKFSKPMIRRYTKRYGIELDEYVQQKYKSFADFFVRQKESVPFDPQHNHFISPCDGLLSVYPVNEDSSFSIKGSRYRLCDLVDEPGLTDAFCGGLCLILRLTPSDYHHYSFVDDGYISESHYIEGKLHSVNPIAGSKYPVYKLNRRSWHIFDTDHFGRLIQVEVGALAVGYIVNDHENTRVSRGEEMGHFEMCGSSIVILVQKDKLELLPQLDLSEGHEARVVQGMCIGTAL